jgi:hypothetical protein
MMQLRHYLYQLQLVAGKAGKAGLKVRTTRPARRA